MTRSAPRPAAARRAQAATAAVLKAAAGEGDNVSHRPGPARRQEP